MSLKPILARDGDESAPAGLTSENLEHLRALFPSAFREGKVDFDVLRQLLGGAVDDRPERYGLNWHGKRAARQLALTPSAAILRPDPGQSVDWDTTQNLMIEGDNLEVLKLLQKPCAGQVKLIYIDPPYNTGKDFIYPDNFRDSIQNYLEITGQTGEGGAKLTTNPESSGRFHTDWLNMMYPRLFLARNLLRDDGAIFVSIDDHEVGNLRLVMDEIFGPENFVATVIWQKVYSPKNSARQFSDDHDYLVAYARSAAIWSPALLPRTEEMKARYSNPDNDPRGPWKPGDLSARNYYSEGTYAITCPSGRVIDGPPPGTYWRFAKEKFQVLDREQRIWWGESGDNVPAVKRFLSEVKAGVVPQTLWGYEEVGHTQEAKKELIELVKFPSSGSVLETPKPTRLVRRMLEVAASPGPAIVMDFFAGSGSTLDAVFRQNADDGQGRRCILVQLPEPIQDGGKLKTIADICRERLRRAGEKVRAENPLFHGDLGFRSFRLDSSNIQPWPPAAEDVQGALLESVEHLKADRSESDILYEVLLRLNLDLCLPIETRPIAGKNVYSAGAGTLFACLDPTITLAEVEPLALGIAAWRDELSPAGEPSAVFRDSAFADDVAKTNCVAILRQHGFADANLRSI